MKLITNTTSWQEKAITLIKDAEGFRATVYTDTTGNQTIGYGFNLSNPFFKNLNSNSVLTEGQADVILRDFCTSEIFPNISSTSIQNPLNDNQLAVMADMIYNLGHAGFSSFATFNGYLANGNASAAAADLVSTEWFSQVGLRGIRNVLNLIVGNNFLYLEN
ncbi:MAG: glycoside hydrolase family protein [Metallibacterium sp.]